MSGGRDEAAGAPADPQGGGVADARFRRSAAFWTRAYPRRWRRARGEELLGLLEDLAEPGARRLSTRQVADVVRGGLATRWREHPPLGPWLLYRLFDVRLPPAYRAWALDDIEGALRRWRVLMPAILTFLVIGVGQALSAEPLSTSLVIPSSVVLTMVLVLPLGWRRREDLRRHVEPRRGEPLAPGTLVPVEAPRRRLRAEPVALWAVASSAVLALTSTATVLVAPRTLRLRLFGADEGTGPGFEVLGGPAGNRLGFVLVLGGAVVVGVLLALRARRGVRRAGDPASWPHQPHRVVVDPSWRHRARVAVWTGLVAAPSAAEVLGSVPLGWSLLVGAAAWAALPAAWLVLVAVRRSRALAGAAAVDVARVASGHRPEVDRADATTFVPWGVVAWSPAPPSWARPVT